MSDNRAATHHKTDETVQPSDMPLGQLVAIQAENGLPGPGPEDTIRWPLVFHIEPPTAIMPLKATSVVIGEGDTNKAVANTAGANIHCVHPPLGAVIETEDCASTRSVVGPLVSSCPSYRRHGCLE